MTGPDGPARPLGHAPERYEAEDDPHYRALEETGFFGRQGAGVVAIARSTGRMLLMLRSEEVEQPDTYGNCGGARHADEDPRVAALREFGEETEWKGDPAEIEIVPALVFRSGDFVYDNHFALIPEEFEPVYGWEAVGHVWCTVDDLPEPLHFGMEALLADPASRAFAMGGWRS